MIKYFYCEGDNCDFKSKHTRYLIYFKGKHLCHHCKLRASKSIISYTNLDINHPPKSVTPEHINRYNRIYQKEHKTLKTRPRINYLTPRIRNNQKVIQVGLTPQEHRILWHHFYEQGLSDNDIDFQIDKIKANIRIAHEEYKKGLKINKPTFQEEFNKMIERKR